VFNYEELSDDELYETLGRSLLGSGLGAGVQGDDHYRTFGRDWFNAKLPEIRKKLCGNPTVKAANAPWSAVDASAVAVALTSMCNGHPTDVILALVVIRFGLSRLCGEHVS
jgi:hypothetical protein